MTTFIEKYFKVLMILLLLILCLLLYARQSIGRYMLCPIGDRDSTVRDVFVLDTKTGQLWNRHFEGSVDLGTCQSPIHNYTKTPNKQ